MEKGKVKFYNKDKKYGFIAGDNGTDYFFHASAISHEIYVKDGDQEEFDVEEGERGPKAVNVSPT